jgi:hypothetical protein
MDRRRSEEQGIAVEAVEHRRHQPSVRGFDWTLLVVRCGREPETMLRQALIVSPMIKMNG